MTDDTHACPGYTCERPECVRRQRDELRDAVIPPREPTEKMIEADKTISFGTLFSRDLASVWRAMYDATLAEKEGK